MAWNARKAASPLLIVTALAALSPAFAAGTGESCDSLAAGRFDPQKPAAVPGTEIADAAAAITACEAAVKDMPAEPRYRFELGRAYLAGKRFKEAREAFTKASDAGYAAATGNLGKLYENGDGVQADLKKAFDFYSRAAAAGVPIAAHNLGTLYRDGRGTTKDFARAAAYFKIAADAKYPPAITALGLAYRDGNGASSRMRNRRSPGIARRPMRATQPP